MAKTAVTPITTIGTGTVLLGSYSNYGQEIVSRVFVDAVGEYRWLTREVEVKNNKATPTSGWESSLGLISTKQARDWSYIWTKDPVEKIRKGDIFKDADGNVYIASADEGSYGTAQVYSVNTGTWSSVSSETMTYGSRQIKVTMQKRAGGERYSSFFI